MRRWVSGWARPAHQLGWALAALTVLGAAARFWHLTTLPPGYWFDEAHKSLVALQILRGERFPVYITDYQGIEAGYAWLLAAWFRVFGPSFYGTRAVSALIGTATLPLTFWSVRRLYHTHPRRSALALTAALCLSFLLWHVHWSRAGLETITVPFFAVAVLGLLAWAGQHDSLWRFGLAGAVLGLSQYTNPGARILPLEALFVFGLLSRGPWQRRAMLGFAFLAGAVVVYAPLGWFFLNHPEWFLGRAAFASANARARGLPFIFDSAVKILLSFNFRGDVTPRHNLSLRPAFDPLLSLWMAAGLLALVRDRAQARAHLALLGMLAINLLPMLFSDGAPVFGRMLGAVPFLVVLPALGVVTAARALRQPAARALMALSLLASAGWNDYDYFVRFPRQPGLFDAYEIGLATLTQAAMRASETGTGYLIVSEADLAHPEVKLAGRLAAGDLRLVNGQTCLAYPARTTQPTGFAVRPNREERLRQAYPQAIETAIIHEPQAYLDGALFSVPAGQTSAEAALAPLAQFGDEMQLLAAEWAPGPYAPGARVPVTLRWLALRRPALDYTSFVHLASAGQPYWAGADAQPCAGGYPTSQWHPGEMVEYQLPLQLPADLPAGRYDLLAGMYDLATGQRLPVTQPAAREPDRAYLGSLIVQ